MDFQALWGGGVCMYVYMCVSERESEVINSSNSHHLHNSP